MCGDKVREQQKIIVLELCAIIMLLMNNFVVKLFENQYVGFLFLVTIFGIMVYFKGFEKDKSERTLDICFNMISYCISYMMFIYIIGIFTGYAKPVYNLSFQGIIKNIVPVILIIVAEELLRYEIVTKVKGGKQEKLALFLLFLLLTLFDSRYAFPLGKDIKTILDNVSLIILPSIAKNVMFIYLVRLIGYKPILVYRLLMELPMFFVPIYPNLGSYLTGILEITFPFLVCLLIRKIVVKKSSFFVREKSHFLGKVLSAFIGILLLITILLTSGFFKNYTLGIVSKSMYPGIERGDVVIVKKLNEQEKKDIQLGEILVYRHENRVIVHRVIEKNETISGCTYKTKGDNNDTPDDVTIYEKDIIGVAQYKIPKVGNPSIWLSEWRVKE